MNVESVNLCGILNLPLLISGGVWWWFCPVSLLSILVGEIPAVYSSLHVHLEIQINC